MAGTRSENKLVIIGLCEANIMSGNVPVMISIFPLSEDILTKLVKLHYSVAQHTIDTDQTWHVVTVVIIGIIILILSQVTATYLKIGTRSSNELLWLDKDDMV